MENETIELLHKLGINEELEYDESIPILSNYLSSKVKQLSQHLWQFENDTYILTIDFSNKTYENITKPYEDMPSEGYIFDFHGNVIDEIKAKEFRNNEDPIINVRPFIGTVPGTDHNFYWEFGNPQLDNKNIILEGDSPYKFELIKNFIIDLSNKNIPSVVIDANHNFDDLEELIPGKVSRSVKISAKSIEKPDNKDQINEKILKKVGEKYQDLPQEVYDNVMKVASKKSFNPNLNNDHKHKDKVNFNPFRRYLEYSEEGFVEESDSSVARRFVLTCFNIYPEIKSGVLKDLYIFTIKALAKHKNLNLKQLKNELKFEKADNIVDILNDLFEDDPFNNSGKFDWSYLNDLSGKVKIIDISSYKNSTQRFVYDVILNDLWNYRLMNGLWEFPFFIVLDDADNIDFSINSIMKTILDRGKEYGWSIAFLINGLLEENSFKMLNSIDDRIYFKSYANCIDSNYKSIKLLENSNKDWKNKLINLKEDESILTTHFIINDDVLLSPKPIVVKIPKAYKN